MGCHCLQGRVGFKVHDLGSMVEHVGCRMEFPGRTVRGDDLMCK